MARWIALRHRRPGPTRPPLAPSRAPCSPTFSPTEPAHRRHRLRPIGRRVATCCLRPSDATRTKPPPRRRRARRLRPNRRFRSKMPGPNPARTERRCGAPGPRPARASRLPPDQAKPDLPPGVTVMKSGVVDGMAYTLYSDGSIEAQFAGESPIRFASFDALRAHVEQQRQVVGCRFIPLSWIGLICVLRTAVRGLNLDSLWRPNHSLVYQVYQVQCGGFLHDIRLPRASSISRLKSSRPMSATTRRRRRNCLL